MLNNFTKIKIGWFNRKIVWLILVLIIFRVVVVILTINNIPATNEISSGYWFYNGADGDGYFSSAKSLLEGKYLRGSEPAGLSLIYAPIIFLTSAGSLNDIITLMTIIYGIIFNTIATILVFILAKKFLYKDAKAVFIAILFQIYPYFFYFFFRYFGGGSETILNFTSHRFLQLNFMHIGSDALGMILALSSLLLIFKIADDPRQDSKSGFNLGLISSWAAITRLQNFILLPVYGLILLYYKKYRSLLYCILGSLPLILMQAYFNWSVSGSILKTTAFDSLEKLSNAPPLFSLSYPLKLIEYPLKYNPWLFLPMITGAVLIIWGVFIISKTKRREGVLMLASTTFIIISLLCLWPSYTNPRYFLPVIPALLIYIYVGIENIFLLIKFNFKMHHIKLS